MKKLIFSLISSMFLISCGGGSSDFIAVFSRENGSGTRATFEEILKLENITEEASISNSTSVMLTNVMENKNAIAYISKGSLNDKVKVLKVDGLSTADDNYSLVRFLNLVITDESLNNELVQDFLAYLKSTEAQKTIDDMGYLSIYDGDTYTSKNLEGKLSIGGSSSVTPVIEKLKESYEKLNPNIQIDLEQSDSTTGVKSALAGIVDIGMASRELKPNEVINVVRLSKDAIIMIVNKENKLDDISTENIKKIYTGELTDWTTVK